MIKDILCIITKSIVLAHQVSFVFGLFDALSVRISKKLNFKSNLAEPMT
jgi:hypothetical protein